MKDIINRIELLEERYGDDSYTNVDCAIDELKDGIREQNITTDEEYTEMVNSLKADFSSREEDQFWTRVIQIENDNDLEYIESI